LYLPRAISSMRARLLSCGMIPMTIFLVISLLGPRRDSRLRKNDLAVHVEKHVNSRVAGRTLTYQRLISLNFWLNAASIVSTS
jgi:hypothetical protein